MRTKLLFLMALLFSAFSFAGPILDVNELKQAWNAQKTDQQSSSDSSLAPGIKDCSFLKTTNNSVTFSFYCAMVGKKTVTVDSRDLADHNISPKGLCDAINIYGPKLKSVISCPKNDLVVWWEDKDGNQGKFCSAISPNSPTFSAVGCRAAFLKSKGHLNNSPVSGSR